MLLWCYGRYTSQMRMRLKAKTIVQYHYYFEQLNILLKQHGNKDNTGFTIAYSWTIGFKGKKG